MSYLWILTAVGIILFIFIIALIIIETIPTFRLYSSDYIVGCNNGDGPTTGQTAAFRMTNHCCETIWVEARMGNCSNPLPGKNNTVFKVEPGSFIDFEIPNTGLADTRFWAKWGCDDNGTNCEMGDQEPTWPLKENCPEPYGCTFDQCPTGGICPPNGCTPPIDTMFEATWGCVGATADCNYNTLACTGGCNYKGCSNGGCDILNNITTFDINQINGWTFPYHLHVKGNSSDLEQCNNGTGPFNINALGLSLNKCPTTEDLTNNGNENNVINPIGPTGPITYSTESVDLRLINSTNNEIMGCFSPCQKLIDNYPNGFGQINELEGQPPTNMYCCTDPPITSTVCQQGPLPQTQYVENVHSMALGVVAYPYDQGIGIQTCPAVNVIYELELCGSGASIYPYPL